jgi:deoxyribonuclease-4
LILGAHLSTAGGVSMALRRAVQLRCNAVQLFTHSRAQWKIKPLDVEEVERFRDLDASRGPFALAAHASYLINLASPDRRLRERSIRTVIKELHHCRRLEIPLLVFHPGAHMGAGEKQGLRRVSGALNRIHRAAGDSGVRTVIETTAGQGSGLGWRFEQIAEIVNGLDEPGCARVCFDTAHAFAAGYDFRTPVQYRGLWTEFDRLLGLEKLAIFHFNDSRAALGSRVDRHAHIGKGEIGRSPFGWILADERFKKIPKVLETPKEGDMDRKNLSLLRRLARAMPAHRGSPEG